MPQVGFKPKIPVFKHWKTVHTLNCVATVINIGDVLAVKTKKSDFNTMYGCIYSVREMSGQTLEVCSTNSTDKKRSYRHGPEMLPIGVIALQISISEKVFEAASLCKGTSLIALPHGLRNMFEDSKSILNCVATIHNTIMENLYIGNWCFINNLSEISPKENIQRIDIQRASRPCRWSSSTNPMARVPVVKTFSSSVLKRAGALTTFDNASPVECLLVLQVTLFPENVTVTIDNFPIFRLSTGQHIRIVPVKSSTFNQNLQ
jgi:hypothetical protein